VEQRYLAAALRRVSGNKTEAARLLGITFRSFRYRLQKLGMEDGTP
jgi:two-component system response regulator PilR (NtrC family)